MTRPPEHQPWPKFPEDIRPHNPYWLLKLMEYALPAVCPRTFALESQVRDYLFSYIRPHVNKLHAELDYVDTQFFFFPGEVVRIFYISGFKKEDEPKIKEILVKNKLDWPMSVYQSDRGRTIHLVMTSIEEPIEQKPEIAIIDELPLMLKPD